MKKSLLLISVVLFLSFPLWATWSIVAVDPETGEVGSAGASYTPSVWPVLGIAGGHGVLVAQAAGNEGMRVKAVEMLMKDIPAADILSEVTNKDVNPGFDNQQWGIISLSGGSAGFTGIECENWRGQSGDDLVMVQGNILVDEAVVADTLSAYRAATDAGLPLAEALVKALAAGSEAGGDKRSGDPAIAAMTAYVAVASPGDKPGHASFAIIVPPLDNGGNPVTELERLYYENDGSNSSLFFPSINILIIFFIVVPMVLGLLLYFILRPAILRKKSLPAFSWTFAILGAMTFQQILQFVLQQTGWALPIYGFFAWVYPVVLAFILIICLAVISILRRSLKWI